MKTFIGGLTAGFAGWLLWLFTRKPPYRTEPQRPAHMWTYPDVERLNERAWRKWAQDARRRGR